MNDEEKKDLFLNKSVEERIMNIDVTDFWESLNESLDLSDTFLDDLLKVSKNFNDKINKVLIDHPDKSQEEALEMLLDSKD